MGKVVYVMLLSLGILTSIGFFEDAFAGPPPPEPRIIDFTGTIRDFQISHPDFEALNGHNHVAEGMVLPTISSLLVGDDRNPVYNPAAS